MTEVVLYDYWRSSASYRVRIALNLAGISYRSVSVDLLKTAQKSPEHLARNPQGLVPVLDIDGMRLTQSLAILEYLDHTRALNLLPTEPGARAQQQALAHSIAVDIHPVCNLSVVSYAAQLADGREGAREDWMQRFIRPGLMAFERMLDDFEQAPFCCGATPGLADLCLIPQIYNARRWGVDISDLPRLLSVETACAAHPAFAAAYPETCKPAPT
ncbi:maleylacetoacetate isomerase [Rhodobacteraceae bacterium F11138]|nr:maleylacetoacetate isomerase [Rhodobacteraceae bacterium F11138]